MLSKDKRPAASASKLRQLLYTHYNIIKLKKLGDVCPFKASLHVQANVRLQYFKPSPVPFIIKDAVEEELDEQEQSEIITKRST